MNFATVTAINKVRRKNKISI